MVYLCTVIQDLLEKLKKGETRAIARAISMVENHTKEGEEILQSLNGNIQTPVIGVTGPPGAGKSTLVNALATQWAEKNLKIAIIAVDPSSPFNFGALLGDRLRMAGLYMNPNVFIRSVSSRGSLGGLSASIIEITEVFKNAGFDRVLIETVGVGQSEVEIAGIADTTIVVVVPESGDEVQTLKSGVMEIADIFVVNKSDRPGADSLCSYLTEMAHHRPGLEHTTVVKTSATQNQGIELLDAAIEKQSSEIHNNERRFLLLAEKLEKIIVREKMKGIALPVLINDIKQEVNKPGFNLYTLSKKYL